MHSRDKSAKAGSSMNSTDPELEMNYISIKKEIEFLTSSHMSWKDKKEVESRKVVSLGGKAQKKQRLPLSVARPIMKKQKEREQKLIQEELINLGGRTSRNNARRSSGKRKPEDWVLKSSEGNFRKGVLDVKHLLRAGPSRRNNDFPSSRMNNDFGNEMVGKGSMKGGKKKNNKGKKKGGGKKRH